MTNEEEAAYHKLSKEEGFTESLEASAAAHVTGKIPFEPEFIVTARWPVIQADSIKLKCEFCSAEVGLSSFSQEVQRQYPKAKIICIVCVSKLEEEVN